MKTRMTTILICLGMLLLLDLNLAGQITGNKPAGKLTITGIVYDKESREPLSNAFFSVNSQQTFSTNELGRFLFTGHPGDTITYSYVGYENFSTQIPDSLAALEYLLGIFMTRDTIMIPEIVIFPRPYSYPSIVMRNELTPEMLEKAQANVDRATFQGLTQPVKTFDADMNAKQTMRIYQMRAQNKGIVATPENSISLSTQSLRTYHLLYGAPITTARRISGEMITQTEAEMIIGQYGAEKKTPARSEQE